MDTSHNNGFIAYPYIIAYYDVAFVVPRRGDILPVQSPLLEKERERIVGQRSQRVVGTGEQEPCAARYRTEPAEHQPVAVDGVVVQDVVLFELRRVVHEIVVDRLVAHLNTKEVDQRIQIICQTVVRTEICF